MRSTARDPLILADLMECSRPQAKNVRFSARRHCFRLPCGAITGAGVTILTGAFPANHQETPPPDRIQPVTERRHAPPPLSNGKPS